MLIILYVMSQNLLTFSPKRNLGKENNNVAILLDGLFE